MICYKERNLLFCTLYGVWGDDFHQKKIQILEKKNFILFHFIYYFYVFFLLLLLHKY